MPGPGTKTFLEAWALDMRHRNPFSQIVVSPKDQIVVCNGSYCVTYTMTDSNSYFGGQATPQTSNPGGGAGTGAGGGGAGGANPGAGCHGNCGGGGGKVTVKPLIPVRPD